jgi:hypothetical protein
MGRLSWHGARRLTALGVSEWNDARTCAAAGAGHWQWAAVAWRLRGAAWPCPVAAIRAELDGMLHRGRHMTTGMRQVAHYRWPTRHKMGWLGWRGAHARRRCEASDCWCVARPGHHSGAAQRHACVA